MTHSSSPRHSVLVIGGGIAGLASAALLAKDGYSVTVLEKNKRVGGRANLLQKKGFRFDMGPSWYLMPDVFDRFFAEFDSKPSDFFSLTKVNPQYRIFFADGSHVDISTSLKKNLKTFEKIEKGSSQRFLAYLAEAEKKYEIAINSVLYRNVDSWLGFFNWELIKHGRDLHVFETMDSYVKRFFKTEKMQQIIQYTLVFLGGSPSTVPALYSLMTHVDFNMGAFYPEGGFYAVVGALKKVGASQGVKYITNAEVTAITTESGQITSVTAQEREFTADYIISNADLAHTESLFSDSSYRMYDESYWKSRIFSPSAFLIFLGVKGSIPELDHHSIMFGKDWITHFEQIFSKPEWPQFPSLYINKPSATDTTVAPKGHENLMVLVPIAPGLEETPAWKEAYAQFILSYIEESIGINLKKRIVLQEIFSVSDFASMYNSYNGNALGGLAHTLRQTGLFRPNNTHRKLRNLFFAGAGTVPGIGVPPALISGSLVRDRVRKATGFEAQ